MMKVKYYKCPICKEKYQSLKVWGNHMEKKHPESIPEGYSISRYFYYTMTGRTHGSCLTCKEDTNWNESAQKYERYCEKPICKQIYRDSFKNRMINKHGKVCLLNDPEMQRRMLKNRRISGSVKFKDGNVIDYVGSYEHDFLKMMNTFLRWSGNDIMSPSPHTYMYDYINDVDKENEGEKFYIPDYYIPSLNLEIEIKQTTNMHHKILAIDKVKEEIKDKVMKENPNIQYIKILDKNYAEFFDLLLELKNSIDEDTDKTPATESSEIDNTRKEIMDILCKTFKEKGFKLNTSKCGEWGENNFLNGKDDSLCLGSYKKEDYNKIFAFVKDAVGDKAKVKKDNYFTIFVKAPTLTPVSESYTEELEPATEGLLDFFRREKEPIAIPNWGYNLLGFSKAITNKIRRITIENNMITIKGINYRLLYNRIRRYYGDKSLYNIFNDNYDKVSYKRYMKKRISKSDIIIEYLTTPEFFALELVELFITLGRRYNDNVYKSIATEIYNKSWLKTADDRTDNTSLLDLKPLENITLEFKEYQKEFIASYPKLKSSLNLNGYILSFTQGLGKTLTAIGLSECLHKDYVYIVCPNALKDNWALEIKKYYSKYENEKVWREEVCICGHPGFKETPNTKYFITNNESINKMLPYIKDGNNILILDESQNFRNVNSKRAKELQDLSKQLNCKDNLVMSGTPIKAAPAEIVPALQLIDPTFTHEAAVMYSKAFKLQNQIGTELVQKRFGLIIYRRDKSVLDKLPAKTNLIKKVDITNPDKYIVRLVREEVMERFAEIYKEKLHDYDDVKEEYRKLLHKYTKGSPSDTAKYEMLMIDSDIGDRDARNMHELDREFAMNYIQNNVRPYINNKQDLDRFNFLEKRFVQMYRHCLGKALGEIIPPRRNELFIAMYEQNKQEFYNMILNNDAKTVIFTQFKKVSQYIYDDLIKQNIGAVLINGDVPNKDRIDQIRAFKEDGDILVIVATSQTLGTGVTLTEANQMLFFGSPWRSTDMEQCSDRIHRIGQTSDVFIHNVLLNTGADLNLSTRMDSILSWSSEMFASSIEVEQDKEIIKLDETIVTESYIPAMESFLGSKLISRNLEDIGFYKSGNMVFAGTVDIATLKKAPILKKFKENVVYINFDSILLNVWEEQNKYEREIVKSLKDYSHNAELYKNYISSESGNNLNANAIYEYLCEVYHECLGLTLENTDTIFVFYGISVLLELRFDISNNPIFVEDINKLKAYKEYTKNKTLQYFFKKTMDYLKFNKKMIDDFKLIKFSTYINTDKVPLYHISQDPTIRYFNPSVPASCSNRENLATPRICVSDTLNGCIIAISEERLKKDAIFFVYRMVMNRHTRAVKPSVNHVYDVNETGECWILDKVSGIIEKVIRITDVSDRKQIEFKVIDDPKLVQDCIKLYKADKKEELLVATEVYMDSRFVKQSSKIARTKKITDELDEMGILYPENLEVPKKEVINYDEPIKSLRRFESIIENIFDKIITLRRKSILTPKALKETKLLNRYTTVPYHDIKDSKYLLCFDITTFIDKSLNDFHIEHTNYYIESESKKDLVFYSFTVFRFNNQYGYFDLTRKDKERICFNMTLKDIFNDITSQLMEMSDGIDTRYSIYSYNISDKCMKKTYFAFRSWLINTGTQIPHIYNTNYITSSMNIGQEYDKTIKMLALESYQDTDMIKIDNFYHDEQAVATNHIPEGTIFPHVVHGDIKCKFKDIKFKPLGSAVFSKPVSKEGNVAYVKEIVGNTEFYNIIATKDIRKGEVLQYNAKTCFPEFCKDDRM